MGIMREDLVGYVLAALEPHEVRRIESRLAEDPCLRGELAELEKTLLDAEHQLAGQAALADVPADLTLRTLQRIDSLGGPADATSDAPHGRFTLRPSSEWAPRGRRIWLDYLVAGLAGTALLGLGIPAVARWRDDARSLLCQDKLREIGVGISQYVLRDPASQLPGLAASGPEAFAGVYSVRMNDQGTLADCQQLFCPDVPLPKPDPTLYATVGPNADKGATLVPGLERLLSLDDIRQANEQRDLSRLQWYQRSAGGSYAYTLGVMDGMRYRPPHYEARPNFAVLGDMPIAGQYRAESVDVEGLRWPHRGSGANVLYEDGSVRHIHPSRMLDLPDHPYVNHRGAFEAGVNIDDASLGPSWRAPFIQAVQR